MSFLIPRQHGNVETNHRGEYLWTSRDGKTQLIMDMAIEHLFYAARMIYNHSVPPAFRVLGPAERFNRYEDIMNRDATGKGFAFMVLTREIVDRDYELPDDLKIQLRDIAANRQFLAEILAD